MGTGFSKKKKQAKMLQQQMEQMQHQLQEKESTGISGNGLVTITLTGDHRIKSLKIKPECVDPEDLEGLEDLIQAAYHDAWEKVQQNMPTTPGMDFGMFS